MRLPTLSRITSSGGFIPEIDGLRFVAIASVVLYHIQWQLAHRLNVSVPSDWMSHLLNNGSRGVPLFFTISGFILGLPFAGHYLRGRPPIQLHKYFMRRVTRLEPPYIISMLLLFGFEVARHRYSRSLQHALFASLLYIHNLIYGVGSQVNGVAWSLEVEIQFYCLVPLLAAVFIISNTSLRRMFIVGMILAVCIVQLFWLQKPRLELSIVNQIQYFLAGFLLADFYETEWRERRRSYWVWDIVCAVGWPLMFFLNGPRFYLLMPFLAFLLYCGTFNGIVFRRILSNGIISTIGGMCYTIYLLHSAILMRSLALTHRAFAHESYSVYFMMQSIFTLPALAVLCTAFFVLIERPCMRSDWPQRLWATARPVTVSNKVLIGRES
jgi:peptidoglycan/LPS O-acetylase OafA/YrhL